MKKTTLALASAIGAVSMLAISAVAQQSPNKPAGSATTPATQAPSATDKAPAPATTDKSPAPEAKTDQPSSKTQSWRGKRKYGQRSHRRHHRARRGGYGGFMPRMSRRWRNLSEEDRKAFFEAKLASIRAGLMMNETQARLWPAVESAIREMVESRRAWRERFKKEGRLASPMDRLKRRGEFLSQRGAALLDLAAAGKPLYDTLSDDQKRRLRILTRGSRKASKRRGMHHRNRGWNRRGSQHRRWHGRRSGQHHGWHRQGGHNKGGYNRRGYDTRGYGNSGKHNRGWGNSTKRWNQSFSNGGLDRGNRMADWRNM